MTQNFLLLFYQFFLKYTIKFDIRNFCINLLSLLIIVLSAIWILNLSTVLFFVIFFLKIYILIILMLFIKLFKTYQIYILFLVFIILRLNILNNVLFSQKVRKIILASSCLILLIFLSKIYQILKSKYIFVIRKVYVRHRLIILNIIKFIEFI